MDPLFESIVTAGSIKTYRRSDCSMRTRRHSVRLRAAANRSARAFSQKPARVIELP
jgi:hypothetical protein